MGPLTAHEKGGTWANAQSNDMVQAGALLEHYSLEMTAKDAPALNEAAASIAPGTQVSVTFLPGESEEARVAAARDVRALGFTPTPHLSARRLRSAEELERYLGRLRAEAAIDRVFVIAGDPPVPEGPYADALAIIKSGALAMHGVRRVGVAGYPEGHPDISDDKLWRALREKHRVLLAQGCEMEIVTQFGFDAEPFLSWIERVRDAGIQHRIRVGAPGPASVKTLLRFAARCGVGASAKVMSKYGVSITRLMNTAGPERLLDDLAARLDPSRHGDVRLHFYPFGGLQRTANWVAGARRART